MTERIFNRGSACDSVEHAIRSRLYLPTDWISYDQFLGDYKVLYPGLFFSQGLEDLPHRERYAKSLRRGKIPCVIIIHVNQENFPHLADRISNAREVLRGGGRLMIPFSPTQFRCEPVDRFSQIHDGLVTIALDKMSNDDLITLNTEVGFQLQGDKKFVYRPYKEYLEQFKIE